MDKTSAYSVRSPLQELLRNSILKANGEIEAGTEHGSIPSTSGSCCHAVKMATSDPRTYFISKRN